MRAFVLLGLLVACSSSPPMELGSAGAPEEATGGADTEGADAATESTGGEPETGWSTEPAASTGGASTGGAVSTCGPGTGGSNSTGGATDLGCLQAGLIHCGGDECVDKLTSPNHCGGCGKLCRVCDKKCDNCPWQCTDGTCDAGMCRCPEGKLLTVAAPDVLVCSADGDFTVGSCLERGSAYCDGKCVGAGAQLLDVACQCPDGYHPKSTPTDITAEHTLVGCEPD